MRSHQLAGGGGGGGGAGTTVIPPFHLLEVTIISAQDLKRATPSMRTYATAYINPAHKVHTRVDPAGGADPTWNDRFIFRVDDAFLRSETATITIDIWAARRLRRRDVQLGTVNIIVSASAATRGSVALLVRRPRTLRPQGILNVGIARIDPRWTSVPLVYSAVGANAFAHNDLVLGSFKTDASAVSEHGEESPRPPQPRLEKKGSVEVGGWVVEKELKELELKLEKWRTELPPLATGSGGRKKSKLTWCFCGGGQAM